ncbi:DUF262 domain-containing protein [Luteolibacter ambystomatis]|uniref:DUF262 domain-containing protein n=1 Tax=Luteolibacter ambystomatis TaxID=2824561 RepID=A0A975G7M9_9BACT|nr:DUF262 domain-containing protein [Luteolibacter ambystomatis]QUE50574.1 DUF262 domain-containing protein [Luteolibacter ambystomatis]
MSKLTNKIEAHDRTVWQVLADKKYTVDFFQREYNWEQRHIEQLVFDLTSAFLDEHQPGDARTKGEDYNNYYLGPFVVSEKAGQRSIIDGQQRLTSLTLLLIYLKNLQESLGLAEKIEPMIFSEHRGMKSFNIQVEERSECLEKLFSGGSYAGKAGDDASTTNMAARYADIEKCFPDDIASKPEVLPFFIDWIKYNVVLVEIIAYSDDNAYTIFETMNDRGLNLTPTEMLKGFLLSRFTDQTKRNRANEQWKEAVAMLKEYDLREDQSFFQAWLRACYADTIRPGKAGSQNEDFEKIGTRFHSWVRDNLPKLGLDPEVPADFERFISVDFKFYHAAYLRILAAQESFVPGLEHVYYIDCWGIAASQAFSLMLAPLVATDDGKTVDGKLDLVARYIETFSVRRAVNFKKFGASSIRYTMYSLVKEIRGKDLADLRSILATKVEEMEYGWDGFQHFQMHGMNRRFVKFLLSRITAHVEQGAGMTTTFQTYFENPRGKPFEIEHIWADDMSQHPAQFIDKADFSDWRNSIGALVLLPNGTNQSFNDKPYSEKLPHYHRENLLSQSLCEITYQNNPNFTKWANANGLPFKPHEQFHKKDIEERQSLYQAICEQIWTFPTS